MIPVDCSMQVYHNYAPQKFKHLLSRKNRLQTSLSFHIAIIIGNLFNRIENQANKNFLFFPIHATIIKIKIDMKGNKI